MLTARDLIEIDIVTRRTGKNSSPDSELNIAC